jgi:hypothetical protein
MQLYILQDSSTSAHPPIVSRRMRPIAGAQPTGTEKFSEERHLRSQC